MKTALVTGASRGIGRAIAEELGRDHHVIVGARSEEAAQKVVDTLPSAEPFVADLTNLTDPNRVPQLESLDLLVHSAGMLDFARIDQATVEMWRRSFDLNVVAVAELTKRLLPAVRNAHGTVVTINSGSGFHSGAYQGIYAATKHALIAFTDALRDEETGKIRVSSVHPGRVDTDMQRQLRSAEGIEEYDGEKWARPESIAQAVRLITDLGTDATIPTIRVTPSGLVL